MSTLPVRRSTRVRSGTKRVPALTPDDSDDDAFDLDSPSPPQTSSRQPKKPRNSRKGAMPKPSSGLSPIFGDGSSHRGKNVVRHDQLRRHAACSSCRRRRTKCDAVKPSCGACVRHRNYLRRSSKGAALEMGDDCGCVYEGGDGDSGSPSGSTEYAHDEAAQDVPSTVGRGGRDQGERGQPGLSASPTCGSSQAESETIVTPSLELPEAVGQMGILRGGPGIVSNHHTAKGKTTCNSTAVHSSLRPSLPGQPALPSQVSLAKQPDHTYDVPYSTSLNYPLQSLPTASGHTTAQSLPQTFDTPHCLQAQPGFSFDAYASNLLARPSQPRPQALRIDTFPSAPSGPWPNSWIPEVLFPPHPPPLFPQRHSAPDFAPFREPLAWDPISTMALGLDPAVRWPGDKSDFQQAQSMTQSTAHTSSGPPTRDDASPYPYFPVGHTQGNPFDGVYAASDVAEAGKAGGDDIGYAAAQRGWVPGSLTFGGAPGEGWSNQGFEERMMAAGTAPGPLSPDQLFMMMQLLGSQVGPMV